MKFQRPLTLMAHRPLSAGRVMPMAQRENTPRHTGHVTITLTRSGSHAALPRRAADPVVVAASIAVTLQTVANGSHCPLDGARVDIDALQADTDTHPAWATLRLRVRARSTEQQVDVVQRIQALAQAQAERYGYSAQTTWATEQQGDGAGRAAHN